MDFTKPPSPAAVRAARQDLELEAARVGVAAPPLERVYECLRRIETGEVDAVPGQRAAVFAFPGLRAQPWHDPARLPWHARLLEHVASIREEALALWEELRFRRHPKEHLVPTGTWGQYYLFSYGTKLEDHCGRVPLTTRLVESIPEIGAAGSVFFASIAPGTRIAPHYGPFNHRLRTHLSLVVPAGDLGIRVGGRTRRWEEGRCLVFDDTFEHECHNLGEGARIVLLVDSWHPELSEVERWGIERILGYFFDNARRVEAMRAGG